MDRHNDHVHNRYCMSDCSSGSGSSTHTPEEEAEEYTNYTNSRASSLYAPSEHSVNSITHIIQSIHPGSRISYPSNSYSAPPVPPKSPHRYTLSQSSSPRPSPVPIPTNAPRRPPRSPLPPQPSQFSSAPARSQTTPSTSTSPPTSPSSSWLTKPLSPLTRKLKSTPTRLSEACANNEISLVTSLLSYPETNPNERDRNSRTPLHAASSAGHISIVSLLLMAGADLESKASYPQTEDTAPQTKKKSSSKNGSVYGQASFGNTVTGVTPLHRAAKNGHFSVVQALLAHGANVNALTSLRQNALHFAAEAGWEGVVELVLRAGVDMDVEMGMRKRTAMRLAANGGFETIMRLILQEKRRRGGPEAGAAKGVERVEQSVKEVERGRNLDFGMVGDWV